MDLTTKYMGLTLKNPLVPSAGPLTANIDSIRRLEDAGASAVVLHSVFEEQLAHEAEELDYHLQAGAESFAESLSYFPRFEEYRLGPDAYLDHVRKAKAAVRIPVIGSLNGFTTGGWVEYARQIEQAGADGIELNVYYVAADPRLNGAAVEQVYVDVLQAVRAAVKIPVAVKFGPYFSSVPTMARRLDQAGADALVMFNRFYQPDIDLVSLEVRPSLALSESFESRLPMRWIAIIFGSVKASLAATTGIATAQDAIKMIMAGADVCQLCSVLLRKGVYELAQILRDMESWMEEKEYDSVSLMKGSMSQRAVPDPAAFERANYMKTLNSYK
ncbi:MAG: dihydroorotate dehydrogenase-like protein [Phycisphaerales bacterium]|nr:dihydroorotate dehydrogenase-like protein [Phycisphaerales bacterium]